MNSFFQNDNTQMHSTHNEGKSVVAERFTIKPQKMCNNKYNNTYHGTTKIKTADVNPSMYINFNKKNNEEDSIFKVDNHVRISKYKKNL